MEKIDLVYLGVDGSDKKYIQKNKKGLKNVSKDRNSNIDELKYSLRSVEKYLNGVNNIFIVTNQQIPAWLNIKNERVKIINQKEILPHNVEACFNSCALEINLYKIKELSEIFLYSNDDFFINKKLSKRFFVRRGKPVQYLDKITKQTLVKYGTYYSADMICINTTFGVKGGPYMPTHIFRCLTKKGIEKMSCAYENGFNYTSNNMYRTSTDLSILGLQLYLTIQKLAILKKSKFTKNFCHRNELSILKLTKKVPIFCINDTLEATDKINKKVITFLEKKFPDKSSFEK